MDPKRNFFVVAFAGCTALSLSCSDIEDPGAGTGGSASGSTGMAGATGVSGTSGAVGGDGSGGTTGTAAAAGSGVGNAAGDGGATGGAPSGGTAGSAMGGSAAGGSDGGAGASAGAGADSGSGAGGAAGSGIAGSSGTAGSGATGGGPSAGCGSPAGLASGRASIDVDGKMREYIIALPSNYDPSHPYKLIFGWHPWGGSAQQIAGGGYFGLSSVIDGQAILVAPEGQEFQNMGLGWGNAGGEDIAFLHAMVDRFNAELCIDQDRIFSTGFSFGAMFSFTLACTADSRMRAIAPQAGNATTSGRCEAGTRPVATMAFIGVDDSLLAGHRQAVQIFVERNGCSTQTAPVTPSWCDGLNMNFQPCSCVEYQGCDAGQPVVECEYKAGHQFAPSAGATLWNFFSQF